MRMDRLRSILPKFISAFCFGYEVFNASENNIVEICNESEEYTMSFFLSVIINKDYTCSFSYIFTDTFFETRMYYTMNIVKAHREVNISHFIVQC